MKILAFHLPQYYVFKENNEWWGENFTDWVNVKNCHSKYEGHNQPRVPYDDFYYDLTQVDTIKWQAELSKQYGIYGFCYYHYWFNGKLLMEKPCELLLKHPEIDQKYCFCWANEPWTRSWDGKDKEVIMPQQYGNEIEWEEHFQYLVKFFLDDRYIKINNMPILILYRTNSIKRCNDMIMFWNQRCQEEGLEGIYVIEEKNTFQQESVCSCSNAILEFEPMYTNCIQDNLLLKIHRKCVNFFGMLMKKEYRNYSYDLTWKAIIGRKHASEKKNLLRGICGLGQLSKKK